MDDTSQIPPGLYCYRPLSVDETTGRMAITPCPFWSRREDKPEQQNGYCALLQRGDWEPGLTHLWDMVKECGINEDAHDSQALDQKKFCG